MREAGVTPERDSTKHCCSSAAQRSVRVRMIACTHRTRMEGRLAKMSHAQHDAKSNLVGALLCDTVL